MYAYACRRLDVCTRFIVCTHTGYTVSPAACVYVYMYTHTRLRKYLRLARLLPTTRSRSRHHHHPTLLANFTPFRFFARPSFFSSFRVECQHYSPRYEINQDRPIKSFSYAFFKLLRRYFDSTRKIGGRSSGKRIEEGRDSREKT